MKFIETKLTEQVFLDRLTRLCRQKERRDKAYAGQDTFVFDRKQEKFWLGSHHAIGGKNPGLSADRLDCSYRVGEDGFVTVAYRRFKHPALFIPHVVVGVLGLLLLVSTLADVIAHRSVSGGEVVLPALDFLSTLLTALMLLRFAYMIFSYWRIMEETSAKYKVDDEEK